MMRQVLVIGGTSFDFVTRDFPASSETLKGADYTSHNGGKGANRAVAAVRAGAKCTMVAAVGTDAAGAAVAEALSKEGTDTRHMQQIGPVSGVAFITNQHGSR
jgi:ribokinase